MLELFLKLSLLQVMPFVVTTDPSGYCVTGITHYNVANGRIFKCVASTWTLDSTTGGFVPSGSIIMMVSGTCPGGYAEAIELNGVTVIGTLAANNDVGTTGGNDNIT